MSIREARTSLCLTQRAVSELLGIPLRTIEDWEAGRRKCPDYVERLVIEKLVEITSKKHGHWEFIEEPNTYDTYGNKVYYARCSDCGFIWTDLYSVRNYFDCCPRCGKTKQKEG